MKLLDLGPAERYGLTPDRQWRRGGNNTQRTTSSKGLFVRVKSDWETIRGVRRTYLQSVPSLGSGCGGSTARRVGITIGIVTLLRHGCGPLRIAIILAAFAEKTNRIFCCALSATPIRRKKPPAKPGACGAAVDDAYSQSGRRASWAAISASCCSVRPMSSSPSSRQRCVKSSIAKDSLSPSLSVTSFFSRSIVSS